MNTPIQARIRRVLRGHSERALVHAVDEASLEYKIEVPLEAVKDVGGSFIVSPDTNEAVIERTRSLGLASYPGFFTPTDAFRAIRAGATGLKAFPAEVLGPKGIRALKAVLPAEVPLYAVGGANPDNFREYFEAGCAGFGLGTYIFKPGMSLAEISSRARTAVSPPATP